MTSYETNHYLLITRSLLSFPYIRNVVKSSEYNDHLSFVVEPSSSNNNAHLFLCMMNMAFNIYLLMTLIYVIGIISSPKFYIAATSVSNSSILATRYQILFYSSLKQTIYAPLPNLSIQHNNSSFILQILLVISKLLISLKSLVIHLLNLSSGFNLLIYLVLTLILFLIQGHLSLSLLMPVTSYPGKLLPTLLVFGVCLMSLLYKVLVWLNFGSMMIKNSCALSVLVPTMFLSLESACFRQFVIFGGSTMMPLSPYHPLVLNFAFLRLLGEVS